MMIKLSHRHDTKEYIDDANLDAQVLRQTYQELKTINRCTWGYWPTMSAIAYFLARPGAQRVVKVLDIGCGDGETLRQIDVYARQRNFHLELTGIDLHRQVIAAAAQLSPPEIHFIHGDIFAMGEDQTYDIIINSLTMHHMDNDQIVELIQWMTAHARIGWSIADLNRHVLAYYFAKYFARIAGLNPVICHDAPLSVARSFRRCDWTGLVSQAGLSLDAVKISWYPNFRYGIRYEKSL